MKKIIIILFCLLILPGCHKVKENLNDNNLNNENIIIKEETPKEKPYIDDNPIKVAIYDGKNKISSYNTKLANFKDIGIFDIYYTDIDTLESSSSRTNYPIFYNQYENIEDYKTGFYITFEAEGNIIKQVILDPTKTHAMTPYLYVYLYDDVNQKPGTYYSHLEPEDMKENTIFSSIKLFLAQEGSKISSPIDFTVFTYNGKEDFDEEGKYRGISSYTITINTK